MTERTHDRRWLVLATGALVGLIAGTLLAPRPPQLSAEVGGDAELAADARSAAGDPMGLERLVVARVADGEIVTAALGGGRPEQRFEIGSIAKVLTGMLLADLAAEGVVSLDEPVSALLPGVPFSDPNVASITLQRLATHHSGLPRLIVSDPRDVIGVVTQNLGADPYFAQGPQAILDDAASVSAGDPAYRYSNFGFALLGQALAARAHTPFAELLRERVLDPLGMDDTTIVSADEPLPEWAVPGRSAGGSARAPWRSTGHAPAGGAIWSTAGDLARLLAAAADGSAPGAEAAEPRADAGGDGVRVGLGWTTSDKEGRAVTWHNGGTGGFSSFAGFDRASGRGAVVLSATSRNVDAVGWRLLGVEEDEPEPPLPLLGATVFLALVGGYTVVDGARARPASATRTPPDRVRAVGAAALGLLYLWIAWLIGPWDILPPVIWIACVGLAGVGLALLISRWRRLPALSAGSTFQRASAVANLVIALAVAGLVASRLG
jgi:CubicO group peptidase (beta-lactamase class C family)